MNTIDTTTNNIEWGTMIRMAEMVARDLQVNPVHGHVAMTPPSGGATNYLPCEIVGLSIIDGEIGWQVVVAGTAYGARATDIIWGDE
jgi:hypothetical protein